MLKQRILTNCSTNKPLIIKYKRIRELDYRKNVSLTIKDKLFSGEMLSVNEAFLEVLKRDSVIPWNKDISNKSIIKIIPLLT